MQNFALDGGALNGDPEVWFDNSSASVAVQGSGVMAIGLSVVGSAPMVVASSLPLSIRVMLIGSAPAHVDASGDLTYGMALGGLAGVHVDMSGDVLRWSMLQASCLVHVDASGDLVSVSPVSAMFNVQVAGALDLYVARGSMVEGIAKVVLSSDLYGRSAYGARLEGVAAVQLASKGAGYLFIKSPPGSGQVDFVVSGNARTGGFVQLDGFAPVSMFAAGSLESWHYVYAGGSAEVRVELYANGNGNPPIPDFYIEAPAMRALRVVEEARRFTVPAERRL